MKTNKSFLKRIRITKNGKLIVRTAGQNHFNAKKTGSKRMATKRTRTISMTNKNRGRFLPNK